MVGWRVSPPLETHKNTPTIGFAEYSDWNRNLPRNGILETGSLKGSDFPDFKEISYKMFLMGYIHLCPLTTLGVADPQTDH